ncbi:MAG: hypothetical protein LBL21_02250, partial [Rickettsiales bacterium]|nr:hypothetical protein [Rickettsiales bacterium]
MRKAIGFFACLAILALVMASIRVCMQIYNYAGGSRVDSVILQPAELWQNRIAAPVPLDSMPDDYIAKRLMAKFAAAYLEVLPSAAELEIRAGPRGALRMMAAPDVI